MAEPNGCLARPKITGPVRPKINDPAQQLEFPFCIWSFHSAFGISHVKIDSLKILLLLSVFAIPVELKCTSYVDYGIPKRCLIYDVTKCENPEIVTSCNYLSTSPR